MNRNNIEPIKRKDCTDGTLFSSELSDTIISELDDLMTIREKVLQSTRQLIQFSSKIINDTHLDQYCQEQRKKLRQMALELISDTRTHPRISHAPYVDDALGEYCEAMILVALINDEEIPTPDELSVDPIPYLHGFGDVVGELRRYVLGCLKRGEIERAKDLCDMMEEVYNFMSLFHYPKAVVNVRRKRDVARSLLEKTLGELVVTSGNIELSRKLDEMRKAKGE